ncbi:MAG: DUF2182 domain-containing protein [Rhodospirillales bacterium]|nr:DUF2182 domain-containing protein [Rhodospirillales bacterium]
MSNDTGFSKVHRLDRTAIIVGLAGVTVLSWLYLIDMAREMGQGMEGMAAAASMSMSADAPVMAWSLTDTALMFAMWWIMMVGMMVPSAAPMILTFATVNRRKREREQPFVPTLIFVAGYLVAWGLFSAGATGVQWGLQKAALLSPMMVSNSPLLGGVLFVAAGIYQWTPLKHMCLKNCRSPFDFVINSWRDGHSGAFRMGWEHGLFCLGCCWLVMAILFAVGVMNLFWVGAIAAFVFLEKLLPAGEWFARLSGGAMIAAGVYLIQST